MDALQGGTIRHRYAFVLTDVECILTLSGLRLDLRLDLRVSVVLAGCCGASRQWSRRRQCNERDQGGQGLLVTGRAARRDDRHRCGTVLAICGTCVVSLGLVSCALQLASALCVAFAASRAYCLEAWPPTPLR
jgi:hypothetical protein